VSIYVGKFDLISGASSGKRDNVTKIVIDPRAEKAA
jgi:hypothetical protein